MSESSTPSSTWFRVIVAGGITVAAVGGLYFLSRPKKPSGECVREEEVNIRLKLSRAMQMSTLVETPKAPSVKKASHSTTAAPSVPAGAGSANRKLCSECQKTLSGLPQRCSSCKSTYYCSAECQKLAWPKHKLTCTKTAAGKSATPAAVAVAAKEPTPSSTPPPVPPKSMQEALAQVLEESSASKSDPLEALFESSVMLFIRGEFKGAAAQFLRVQMMARDRENISVEGETFKWLGHCYGKLSDGGRSESYFSDGAEFAHSNGLPKVEIDCLGGLGMLHRSRNDPAKAILIMARALELADALGDLDTKAGVLLNMGNVLMQVDQEQALLALKQSVALREEAIERLSAAPEEDRSALATAVMEHATCLVSLASALYVSQNHEESVLAYERALEVFIVVEDSEKVVKVLTNLANLTELQLKGKEGSKLQAAAYRDKLVSYLQSVGLPVPEQRCSLCLEVLKMSQPTQDAKEIILLACIHPLHNNCWSKHMEEAKQGVCCPTCSAPVQLA